MSEAQQAHQNLKVAEPQFFELKELSKKKPNSVFVKARVVSINEQESKFSSSSHEKTLIVDLEQIFQDSNQNIIAQIKVHPPNQVFMNNFEEQSKKEVYTFFKDAQQKLANKEDFFIEILNGKLKLDKQKKDQNKENNAENNENNKNNGSANQLITIQLNEWSLVKRLELKFSNFFKGEINNIKDITANNKFVNVLCMVAALKPLQKAIQGSQLQTPEFKPENQEDQPVNYHLTLRDQTGEIFCVLPNNHKFKSFFEVGKYLFFKKAIIQHSSIKEGESNIMLNIYIKEKSQKSKSFILDCNKFTEFSEQIKKINDSKDLINVSNKIWIVKAPQTQNETAK
ncbi:hypothetical protein ABPG74_008359 [Tetrahymena malaccensis]